MLKLKRFDLNVKAQQMGPLNGVKDNSVPHVKTSWFFKEIRKLK